MDRFARRSTIKIRVTQEEHDAWRGAFPPGTLSEIIRRSINELVGLRYERTDEKRSRNDAYKRWL